jgi:hypothetical protein
LVANSPQGFDVIPPSRSQEKKWSDEIRKELLPAWLRDHAHPIVEAALVGMTGVRSRVTESCIFIDYEPLLAPSRYAVLTVMLEFGTRSTGEPGSIRLESVMPFEARRGLMDRAGLVGRLRGEGS